MDELFQEENNDIVEDIMQELRIAKRIKPKLGSKMLSRCKKCGEPTTHKFQIDAKTKKEIWVCLCCESGKSRTKDEVKRIKKIRKGWAIK